MSRTPLREAELKEHNRNELSRGWEEIFETERFGPLPRCRGPPPARGEVEGDNHNQPSPAFRAGEGPRSGGEGQRVNQ
jgi:hypothetical protein